MTDEKAGFEGWVILELMGHRRLAGWLSEQAIGGASFLRIDVPTSVDVGDAGRVATQFYTGSAVYCITPTTETLARKVALNSRPSPVTEWDIRVPALTAAEAYVDEDYEDDDETERV